MFLRIYLCTAAATLVHFSEELGCFATVAGLSTPSTDPLLLEPDLETD